MEQKKEYASLTEAEKEETYKQQQIEIEQLKNDNNAITQSSLKQINALKIVVTAKKDLKAKPIINFQGSLWEIVFQKSRILKGEELVMMTDEELAEDLELCHSLIEIGSPCFKKIES